ncbi:putative purine-cytosine permease [Aspergillus clavatus NRRL 1]|uniref:Purine-cytosine permease, putative n=1 Tax=Aspergillus clavatus (strain ATCC 1007 / CBS 513.65 / DSM 816 / NCTC 3887 / NRRL 1 / QM 1276 / 107) TaxID=344612 RepID=A1CQ25_ASPCL|nr:purine-cytosine permease, putative [Aspergillus clavatus NRRL 1]EAW07746.1 purine-cytosine permease, putative [Aspergillus clavatus NRRL 1]
MVSDIEKPRDSHPLQIVTQEELGDCGSSSTACQSRYQRWARSIKNLETQGVERVAPEDRQKHTASDSFHMLLMWFSMGMAVSHMVVGSIGTLVMQLSFKDAALCALFGNLLGGLSIGYMSTWGPRSGNRTLIVTRYFMGYYPNKVCCSLNVLTNLGYGMINAMVGGQILSKLSGGSVSVVVGIIIVALASWAMATFGMRIFQIYERFAWLPQLLTFCVLAGSAEPFFNFHTVSVGSSEDIKAKRLGFFSLCFSSALSWTPSAADYYVYYPPTVKLWKTWCVTTVGGCAAMIISLLLGVGLGTGVASNSDWQALYDGTPGSLLMAGYDRLGVFGKICAFVNVLTVVSNNAPGAYSMALNFQMLGDFWLKIPLPVFTIASTVIYAGCAIGGRNFLYQIFKNFLPLIGYWIIIWFTIAVEQDVLFNRCKGYDWTAWNDPRKLPVGVAAGVSFLVGWAGAIVGMNQVYYVGPIASAIAGGADLGIWLGIGFTAVAFPPLRFLELKILGR